MDAEFLERVRLLYHQGKDDEADAEIEKAKPDLDDVTRLLAGSISAHCRDRNEESLSRAEQALEAAREAGDKLGESYALRSMADALRLLNRYDGSLSRAEESRAAAGEAGNRLAESYALRSMAIALLMLDRYEESLSRAEEALGGAREAGDKLGESHALRSMADALLMLDRYEESLSRAEEARAAASEAGNRLGESYALRAISEALRRLARHEQSLSAAQASQVAAREVGVALAEANALACLVLTASELGKGAEREQALTDLRRIDPGRAEVLGTYPSRPDWHAAVRGILKEAGEREVDLRRGLHAEAAKPTLPEDSLGCLVVLRRWASYTSLPILRSQPNEQAGGGYLLWWQGWGLAIDPGLGFGDAFSQAGFTPRTISALAATHHHIDHTGDLPAMAGCLFEMNEDGAHEMDFVLGPGAFNASANALQFVPGVRSLQLLRSGERVSLSTGTGGRAELKACEAVHRDLTGRSDAAIALRIGLRAKGPGTCHVGYSSDTRYSPDMGEFLKNVDLMIVHIGSVYKFDIGEKEDQERWHLGFSGVVRLLNEMKKRSKSKWDPLVLVSEWGEELRGHRTDICEALEEATGLTRIWPAEMGARIGLLHREARPLCVADDGKHVAYATHWDVEPEDQIVYRCGEHSHGKA